jgi:hypothetical protein
MTHEMKHTFAYGSGVADTYPAASLALCAVAQPGHVLDMDFGLAALHTLVGVTTGAKPRHAPLSFAFSRRPQHSLSRGKVPI